MKGKISVTVRNNRVQYKFTLNRSLTILRGDSATGKTTLIDMIGTYEANPKNGITVICEKDCRVVNGERWKEQLKPIKDSIVFIDEGNPFLKTRDFADTIKKTDNYYVLVTREALPALPYSVKEVYGIVNKTKGYGRIKRLYSEFKSLYSEETLPGEYDLIIVEDSNAGYSFFKDAFKKAHCTYISAKGKSKIAGEILKTDINTKILVIADGAAFGPEMENVLKAGFQRKVELYLPESFEWLILKSGLIDGNEVQTILENPEDYIESREYFSWERFFNALLVAQTKDSYLAYNKKRLNPVYLQQHRKAEIMKNTPFEELDGKEFV